MSRELSVITILPLSKNRDRVDFITVYAITLYYYVTAKTRS